MAYITGLAGGGTGYFVDNAGLPKLLVGDTPWGLIDNAGRYGGTWQSDMDLYLATRSAQGYNAFECDLVASTWNGGAANESTYDGVHMFTSGGDPSSGLNDTYWQRVDYLLAGAAALDMTLIANGFMTYDLESPRAFFGKTTTQFGDYGAALGARYKNTPNLIWMLEDDYFSDADSSLNAYLTGLRGAGDTHPITLENYPESTSRKDLQTGATLAWGTGNSQYQWVYSYNTAYFGVEQAYKEASLIPVLRGDGQYYNNAGDDQLMRNHLWWALASGSRGFNGGDNRVWPWSSATMSKLADGVFQTSVVGTATQTFAGLQNWHKLIPDTSNTFITSGRGTRASSLVSGGGATAYSGTTDNYVAGSIAPDGSLAVVYCLKAFTITIDASKMATGYQAFWIDPVSGAQTLTTSGSSYSSAGLGNNSAGDPDWALALVQPAQATWVVP